MDESEIGRLRDAAVPGDRSLVAKGLVRAVPGKPVDVISLSPRRMVGGAAGFWADRCLRAPTMDPHSRIEPYGCGADVSTSVPHQFLHLKTAWIKL